jgi:hypothetical protein
MSPFARSLIRIVACLALAAALVGARESCPSALSRPSRTWLDPTTGELIVSRPYINKNGDVAYTSPEPMIIKGIGYQPTPIGKNIGDKPFGDYYGSKYDYFWKTDLARMSQIGANLVRVWAWKFDQPADHVPFLDELYNNNMFVLIPFEMLVPDGQGKRTFEDLSNDDVRKDAVDSFRRFAKNLISHPAVLGFLIGNELEDPKKYGNEMVILFSTINEMISELRKLEREIESLDSCRKQFNCRHLVTTPFKEDTFAKLYNNFFWSKIDFWAVQPYSDRTSLESLMSDYADFASGAVGVNTDVLKPLLLTERGAASVHTQGAGVSLQISDDDQFQADFLRESWETVQSFAGVGSSGGNSSRVWGSSMGMVIMEWQDEWWKGTINTLPLDGCPDADDGAQSNCGIIIESADPIVVAEEKLGICAQVKNDRNFIQEIFLDWQKYDLKCKRGFTEICRQWGGRNCDNRRIERQDKSAAGSTVLILNVAPFACLIITLLWGAILICMKRREEARPVGVVVSSSSAVPGGVTVDTVNSSKRFNAFLTEEADFGAADPRLDWICEDLIRRVNISDESDIDKIRGLWVCVVTRLQPSRQHRPTFQHSNRKLRRFTEHDTVLPVFVDAIDMLHKETMCHVGMHSWYDKFDVTHHATRAEPDMQLQELTLYYAVRLEHHTIAHAVEFTTENYLTMRDALLLTNAPVTENDRIAAWSALADRVDEAYNIMCNGQLRNRIHLANNTLTFTKDEKLTRNQNSPVVSGTCDDPQNGEKCNALQFSPDEMKRFRTLAASLDRVHGDEYIQPLRPDTIDEQNRIITFRPRHMGTLSQESRPAFGNPTKQGTNIALDVCYALEALHNAGVAHGSIDADHIGYFKLHDGRMLWTLVPTSTMDKLTPERQKQDVFAIGEMLERMAAEVDEKNSQKLLMDLSRACRRPNPISMEVTVEHLEGDLSKRKEDAEKPPSYEDLNQTAFDQRSKYGNKNLTATLVPFRRSFREQGGLLAALTVYSWFVRYMLWQWIYSWTSQPISHLRPMCLQRMLEILSVADALLCIFTYAAEIRVLYGGTHHAKLVHAVIFMLIYGAAFVILLILLGFKYIVGGQIIYAIDFVISPHSIYVVAVIILFLVKDIVRFTWTGGRGEHQFYVRPPHRLSKAGALLRGVIYALNWVIIIAPIVIFTDFGSRDTNPNVETARFFLPFVISLLATVIYNLFLMLLAYQCRWYWLRRLTVIDGQLGSPAIFWALNYFSFNMLMTYFIVPGVAFIDWNLCVDQSWEQFLACHVAWIFNWLAFVVVSFALFGILYVGWSLLASILVAFARSIGELHSIRDVVHNIKVTRARERVIKGPLINVKGDPKRKLEAAVLLFEVVLDALVEDHKLSLEEKEKLLNWFRYAMKEDAELDPAARDKDLKRKMADASFRLVNDDAETCIVMFFATLELLPAREGYTVASMPSFTVVVPHFNENVYHDFKSMRCQQGDLSSGVPSDLRHAAAMWSDEWRRLVEQLRKEGVVASSATGDEVLETYHRICENRNMSRNAAKLVSAIELWVTYRNQTLSRNVRGLGELRRGLAAICRMELSGNGEPFMQDNLDLDTRVEQIINQKMQVIVAAQTMSKAACNVDTSKLCTRMSRCQLVDLVEMQAANPFVELVYELESADETAPVKKFEAMLDHARAEIGGMFQYVIHDRVTPLSGRRAHYFGLKYYSCHVKLIECNEAVRLYELHTVERPGPLLLGPKYARMAPKGLNTQGKAENQFHGAQFARGSNFFTLDMNQDMCVTEGYKLPTMLHHFLGGNKRHRYGIIGFTERSYTRTTSLAGEMAGAAEFAFVTIVQRVLRSALRIRMHYGHPDLMSGLLARTIGFHKASHGSNVNEDIFAGYECLARGVPIGFCEWIWFWKGRDTSLRLVAIFNNKLAEGAAQQVRSRDMHFLNCNLDWLSRSSLLNGTIGFYWMSLLLHMSIRLYIWSLLLFEVSGVSNYEIGVVGGIISVAWAFQLGYVMALPGLIENTVQFGLLSGIIRFLRYVVASVFFHAFMLQVVSEGFLTGMYTNSAAYAGTGRGYDLTPVDAWKNFMIWGYSHYWKAVELLVVLVWYASITAEQGISYFLRTLTVWVLVIAMFGAPFFFQCPPNGVDLSRSGAKLWSWMLRFHEQFGSYKNLILPDKIEEAETKSYRTWYARRYASPLYAASLRSGNIFNFAETIFKVSYRELPAVALLICYFQVGMIPLIITSLFIVLQVVVLRRMFSGRFKRHFSRIMLITTLVFVLCLAIFYLAASVLFFAPVVTLILVAYAVRFFAIFYLNFAVVTGSVKRYVASGMDVAIFDFPAAVIAGSVTYFLAWITSKVLRDTIISWNYSTRFAFECRRADFRRYSATAHVPGDEPLEPEKEDWAVGPITRSPLADQRGGGGSGGGQSFGAGHGGRGSVIVPDTQQQQQQQQQQRQQHDNRQPETREPHHQQQQQQQQQQTALAPQPAMRQAPPLYRQEAPPLYQPDIPPTAYERPGETGTTGPARKARQAADDEADVRWAAKEREERKAQQDAAFNAGEAM